MTDSNTPTVPRYEFLRLTHDNWDEFEFPMEQLLVRLGTRLDVGIIVARGADDSWRTLLAPFVRVQNLAVHPTASTWPSSVRCSPSRRMNGPGASYRVWAISRWQGRTQTDLELPEKLSAINCSSSRRELPRFLP
jgi:hypothetical protein